MVIESLQDISTLLVQGFDDWGSHGRIYVRHSGDLSIFNYRQTAIYDNKWPFLERVSRGLIINNKTCRIVARPFDKFFNWNERGRTTTADISLVTEKIDGSLGILYYVAGEPMIATRGSFDGDQAKWATLYFQDQWGDRFPVTGWTLLFEIVYPENKIIIDYGETKSLVLLAARAIGSGEYMPYEQLSNLAYNYDFDLVPSYAHNIQDLVNAQEKMDSKTEGFVAYFKDGSIFKFKSHEYMALYKMIMGLSFKNTVKAIREGKVEELERSIPEEFLGEFSMWRLDIGVRYMRYAQRVSNALGEALDDAGLRGNRKEFAMWVLENYPDISHLIFAAVDDKDYEGKIFDMILKGGEYE